MSHCEEEASGKRPLHAFRKLFLTEELRTKALLLYHLKVLYKLTVGYLVANELKYHSTCLVICRWGFKSDAPGTKTCHSDTCNKVIEEVLAIIDEDISAGRTCITLNDVGLYEETCQRKRHFGDATDVNRTRLKDLVTERVPVLKEEIGFRREVMLVPALAINV